MFSLLSIFLHAIIIISVFTLIEITSKPIDIPGENIKYYKLTPNEGSGSYRFDYGTADGAERSERGYVKQEPGSNETLMVITGTFKYPNKNGDLYEVSYIADENGYRILPKLEQNEILHGKTTTNITEKQQKATLNEIDQPTTTKTTTVATTVATTATITTTTVVPTYPNEIMIKSKPGESKIIGVQLMNTSTVRIRKPYECPPGKCSGARQSKLFVIKPFKNRATEKPN